jgi:hypothetical protein
MVDRGTAGGGSTPRRTRRFRDTARRVLRKALAAALPVALVLLASLSAGVSARPARERAPEQAQLSGEKRAAAQEQRAAAHRAKLEAAKHAREERAQRARAPRTRRAREQHARHKREPHEHHRRPGHHERGNERENAVVTSTCTVVHWTYRKFPNLPSNTIIEKIEVAHMPPVFQTARFDGEGAVVLSPINPPPGHSRVDTGAKWKGNGIQGGFDIHSRKKCPPAPAFTIEKLQRISGPFTKSPLSGLVGQIVEYEMIVRNTGNVPLVFSNFSDPRCDPETIKGGPGSTPLQPGPTPETGESSTFTCSHQLLSTEPYENNATVTATPEPGKGSPLTHESNTVVVNAPSTSFTIEKLQKIEGEYTTSPLPGEVGQTVTYEVIVKNTGNVSLLFSSLTDAHCDSGTISGGPGGKTVAPGESTTFTCHHMLTSADQSAGSYSNHAEITGSIPPPPGPAETHISNTVVVNLAPAGAPIIYVAYADGAANDHGGASGIPSPWKGSPGVTFIGCGFGGKDSCPTSNGVDVYDAGAVRVEATASSGAVAVTGASVTVGPCKYEPWPGLNSTVQPGQSLILTQTGKHKCASSSSAEQDNFDTSESFLMSPQYQQFLKTGSCSNDGYIPAIALTLNGKTTTFNDTGQVLNNAGIDNDICKKTSEAVNWVQLPSNSARRFARTPTCQATTRHRHRGRARGRELCPRRLRTT